MHANVVRVMHAQSPQTDLAELCKKKLGHERCASNRMIPLVFLVALATIGAPSLAASSLRAEYSVTSVRAVRSFRGTLVVVAGHELYHRVEHQRFYDFVDDETGQSFEVIWAPSAIVSARQSTHGTLIASLEDSTYTASLFKPGAASF